MNAFLEKISKSATDTGSMAKSIADAGMRYVSTALSGLRIDGSIHALTEEDLERDETHYLLIPQPASTAKFMIYTRRVIPSGEGVSNSLPKVRIFHVPDRSAQKDLENILVERAVAESGKEHATTVDFAERLDRFADQIDDQTSTVSGGLLLIGGAIVCFNPLIGVGIAATGLLSAVGIKAASAGVSYLGDKVKTGREAKQEESARREARKEVNRLKPEVFENPLLKSLDAVLTNRDAEYDPFLDDRNRVDAFEDFRYFSVTVEAISDVFGEKETLRKLDPNSQRWIRHLVDLAAEER